MCTAARCRSTPPRILGMRFEYLCNLGAYLAFTAASVNTVNLVNVRAALRVQASSAGEARADNTVPPPLPRRGPAGQLLAIERLVDQAAHESHGPGRVRRRTSSQGQISYRIATGFEYDCGTSRRARQGAEGRGMEFIRNAKSGSRRGRLRGKASPLHRGERRGRLRALRPGTDHVGRDAYITLRATCIPTARATKRRTRRSFPACWRADGVDPAAHRRPRTCSCRQSHRLALGFWASVA